MNTNYMQTNLISTLMDYCSKRGGRSEAAKSLGISYRHLCFILRGDRAISDAIARKLGYEKITAYQKMAS